MKRTAMKPAIFLMALVMILTVFAGLLPNRARAHGETLQTGGFYDIPICTIPAGWELADIPNGDVLVPGMYLKMGGNIIFMEGSPTTAGTFSYHAFAAIRPTDRAEESGTIEISWNITVVCSEDPVPTPGPAPSGLEITKQPSSETVDENAGAVFVAKAVNYVYMTWYLVSPGNDWIAIKDAPTRFPYLGVNGSSSTKLVLTNIPESLNGYRIVAQFIDAGGNEASTDGNCLLTVNRGGIGITKSPTSETVNVNGACTFVTQGVHYKSIYWYLVSPENDWHSADHAAARFSGLQVSYSADRTALYLSNIPAALDGFRIYTLMKGADGKEVCTNGNCTLTVKSAVVPVPAPATPAAPAATETPAAEPTAAPAPAAEPTAVPAVPPVTPASVPIVTPAATPTEVNVQPRSSTNGWMIACLVLCICLACVLSGTMVFLGGKTVGGKYRKQTCKY